MTKVNYSQDIQLLPNEIDDFDTIDYATTGEHPTGINLDRMRLPERYDISKEYKRSKKNKERGKWVKKEVPLDFAKDFDWQITYTFPSTLHNPFTSSGAVYGSKNMTYRRLYLILCEHFNGGRYFVDDYFENVYPSTLKPLIDDELNLIKEDLLEYASYSLENYVDEEGRLKRGGKARIKEFKEFAKEWNEMKGEELSSLIKEDIINSLATGIIPLQHKNSFNTLQKRHYAGITSKQVFYATSDLINHIILYVNIGENRKWVTKQGILV